MSCPSELTLCEYADGELPAGEAAELRAHLALCGGCRALEASLAAESGLLREALGEPETVPSSARSASVTWRWAWAAALLLSAGPALLDAAWQATPSLPRGLAWVKDFGGVDRWWTLSRGPWAMLFGGEDMLVSLLGFVVTLTVALATLALASVRRLPPLASGAGTGAALGVALALLAPTPAHAAEMRCEEGTTVRVAADEVVDDSVFLFGETALVAGVVEGDLFVAAERVEITGTVRGNVYGGAESLTISGQVEGSVHAIAETVELSAPVGGSAYLAGETVSVTEGVSLAFGAFLAGETVRMKGTSERDLYFGADSLELSGTVARHVRGWGNGFAMASGSSIGGDLRLTVTDADAVHVDDGATIAGKREVKVHHPEEERPFLHGGFYFGVLAKWLAMLLLGFVAVTLFPGLRPAAPSEGLEVLKQMGVGFVVLVATPVAVVIVALTLIGLPLALVTLAVYGLLLFASLPVVASFAAERLPLPGPEALRTSLVLLALLLLTQVPLVGPGVGFLATLVGMGALVAHLYGQYTARAER